MGLSLGFLVQGSFLLGAGAVLTGGGNEFWMGLGTGTVATSIVWGSIGIALYQYIKSEREQQAVDMEEQPEAKGEDEEEVTIRMPMGSFLRNFQEEQPTRLSQRRGAHPSRVYRAS